MNFGTFREYSFHALDGLWYINQMHDFPLGDDYTATAYRSLMCGERWLSGYFRGYPLTLSTRHGIRWEIAEGCHSKDAQ